MQTTSPTFKRVGVRGVRASLVRPLPRSLADRPELRELAERHAAIAGKLAEQRELVVKLTAAAREGRAQDQQAAIDAELNGSPPPPTSAEQKATGKLEEATGRLATLEAALGRSADELLAAAVLMVPAATETVTEAEEHVLQRAADLLEAADAALAELSDLGVERRWLRTAHGQLVEPFANLGGDQAIRRCRGELRSSFERLVEGRAQAQARAEEWAAREAADAQRDARRAEEAQRQSEARKVVIER